MTKNSHVLYFDNHYTAPVMVRGKGMMIGLEFVKDKMSRESRMALFSWNAWE